MLPALSEHDAPPVRVLVHDPVVGGGLDRVYTVSVEELEERFLFRAYPDRERFSRDHRALAAALSEAGAEVVDLRDVVLDADALGENPNQVYTRDPAITLPWLPGWFLRGRMRKHVRRGEPGVLATALSSLGLRELPAMPRGVFLEGGDVIPLALDARRTLLVGFGPRTSRESIDVLLDLLHPWALDDVIGVELVPERMNLDGVLVPVADDAVLVDPSSIVRSVLVDAGGERPVDALALLREIGMDPLTVTREEATEMQACNCVCLGARRVITYDLCERVTSALQTREIDVRTIPGQELIKGTGGPRCMTRPLYV